MDRRGAVMPQSDGPWGRKRRPALTDAQRRLLIFGAIVAAGGLGLWELSRLFPNALTGDFEHAYFLRIVGALLLVSSTFVLGRRFEAKETIRNVAIWCGVFAVFVLIYSFRDELASVGNRIRGELVPGYAVATGAHEMTLTASADGSFYVHGEVNGAPAQFLVDTGASDIVLSPADATRAGIDLTRLSFARPFETAHGTGWGATTLVKNLSVGMIELHDVLVTVNKSEMDSSLLGLTFLHRLESFDVRGRRLTLRWRS
jgi:aspartyl protease family protein